MWSARASVWCRLLVLVAIAWAAAPPPAAAQSAASRNGHVYLLRGLANVFSLGMDTLAQKLNARGVTATVHTYAEWQTLAARAVEESKATGGKAPIIIIGHSLGADAAVYMANRAVELGGPVPLVVTFDPVTPRIAASPKIGQVVNYYQSGGSGKAVLGGNVSNVDLTSTGNLSHFNIEKAADLHDKTIAMVLKSTNSAVARKPRRKPVVPTPAPEASPADAAAAPGPSSSSAEPQTVATPVSAPASAPAAIPVAASPATPAATPAAATSAPASDKSAAPM